MIIDSHVHITEHANVAMKQQAFTAEELIKHMDGPFLINGEPRRVDKALAQGHPTGTIYETDIAEHHRYVAECVNKYPDRLIGCMIINPHLSIDNAIEVLRDLVSKKGFRAIKLHPTVHGYLPQKSMHLLGPVLEEAAKLDIPVIVHTGDPPFALPVLVAPLAEAHPKTKIIVAHLGTQQVNYSHQAIYMARKNPNIYLEAGWGILLRIKDAVVAIGPERVINASDCPIQDMGSQLRLIEVLGWDPPFGIKLSRKDVENIMGDNIARLLG